MRTRSNIGKKKFGYKGAKFETQVLICENAQGDLVLECKSVQDRGMCSVILEKYAVKVKKPNFIQRMFGYSYEMKAQREKAKQHQEMTQNIVNETATRTYYPMQTVNAY